MQCQASLCCFADVPSFLHQVAQVPPDICFIDIALGGDGPNGLEVAHMLRKQVPRCQIIFLTNYLQYVTSSFDVGPTYYILKSELPQRLPAALRLAVRRTAPDRSASFSIVVQHKQRLLSLQSILYFERIQRETRVVCKDQEFQIRESLSSLERRLNDSFFRCHASFIVHFDYAVSMTKQSFLMPDGTNIPISRIHYEEAKMRFSRFLAEKVQGGACP